MNADELTPDEAAALDELVWELSAPHTLEAIAERLGRDRYYVMRVEARALKKLRRLLEEQGLEDWRGGLRDSHKHAVCPEDISGNCMARKRITDEGNR